MIPEHARTKPIELWWQDETRVGQKGSLTYVWALKGTRPAAIRDQRHDFAYIFGAVCPARDLGVGLVMPEVSSEAMNHHLAAIAKAVQPGAHAVITLDGAGWHQTGRRLRLPENISLLPLPPYSPELNPVENIWQFLRQNYLAHRIFDTYDDIVEACCNAWNTLRDIPGKFRSIATRNWAKGVRI